MGQPVIHFEILGADGAALREFYGGVFGWEFTPVGGPMDYATVDREANLTPDGIGIGGGIGANEEVSHQVTFYVRVPDVEAALAEVERRGGRRLYDPAEVPGANIVIAKFADPEGHVVGLISPTS